MAVRGKVSCYERTVRPAYSSSGAKGEIVPQADGWPYGPNGEKQICNRSFKFTGVVKSGDPTNENQQFARASFQFSIELAVANPNVDFEPGQEYYVDFTPAPQ